MRNLKTQPIPEPCSVTGPLKTPECPPQEKWRHYLFPVRDPVRGELGGSVYNTERGQGQKLYPTDPEQQLHASKEQERRDPQMLKAQGMGSEGMHSACCCHLTAASAQAPRESRSLGSGSSELKLQGAAPEERGPAQCPFHLSCSGYSIHSAIRLGSYKYLGREHGTQPKGTGLTRLDAARFIDCPRVWWPSEELGPPAPSLRHQAYLWPV